MLAARDHHERRSHTQPTIHDLVDGGAARQPFDVLIRHLDDVRQRNETLKGGQCCLRLPHDRGTRVRIEAHERVLASTGQRIEDRRSTGLDDRGDRTGLKDLSGRRNLDRRSRRPLQVEGVGGCARFVQACQGRRRVRGTARGGGDVHVGIVHVEVDEAAALVQTDPRRQSHRPTQTPQRQGDVRGRATGDLNGEVGLLIRDDDVDERLADSENVGARLHRHGVSSPVCERIYRMYISVLPRRVSSCVQKDASGRRPRSGNSALPVLRRVPTS